MKKIDYRMESNCIRIFTPYCNKDRSIRHQMMNRDDCPHRLSNMYLVLSNVRKKQNLGTLLRSATAFNVDEVIVVGREKYGTHGAHGAHKHVKVINVYTFEEARSYLRQRDCTIIGIQSISSSIGVDCFEFTSPTAFVIRNEGGALSHAQMNICDGFISIPIPPSLTLDITVEASLILHHFAKWSNAQEAAFQDSSSRGKFDVEKINAYSGKDELANKKTQERMENRLNRSDGLVATLTNMFAE